MCVPQNEPERYSRRPYLPGGQKRILGITTSIGNLVVRAKMDQVRDVKFLGKEDVKAFSHTLAVHINHQLARHRTEMQHHATPLPIGGYGDRFLHPSRRQMLPRFWVRGICAKVPALFLLIHDERIHIPRRGNFYGGGVPGRQLRQPFPWRIGAFRALKMPESVQTYFRPRRLFILRNQSGLRRKYACKLNASSLLSTSSLESSVKSPINSAVPPMLFGRNIPSFKSSCPL